MLRIVARLSASAETTPRRSPEISVTSAASIATSVPVPIATPTSDWASAGASLIPSPTIATSFPSSCSRRTSEALILREHLGEDALDGGGRFLLDRVRDRDDAGGTSVEGREDRGLPLGGKPPGGLLERRQGRVDRAPGEDRGTGSRRRQDGR